MRVGKCMKFDLAVNQFDKVYGIPQRTSWDTNKSRTKSVEVMKQLHV